MAERALIRGTMFAALCLGSAFHPAAAEASAWWNRESPENRAGQEAYERQDFDQAAERFDTLRSRSAGDRAARAAFNQGNALAEAGDYERAIRAFDQAAGSQDPYLRSEALYNRGLMHELEERFDAAKEDYRRALLENQNNQRARINLEHLLQMPPPPPQEEESPAEEQPPEDEEQDTSSDDARDEEGQDDEQSVDPDADDESEDQSDEQSDEQSDDQNEQDEQQEAGSRGDEDEEDGDEQQPDAQPEPSDGEEEQDTAPQPEAGDTPSGEPEEITAEEADRMLQTLDDEPRNLPLLKQGTPPPDYDPSKDW